MSNSESPAGDPNPVSYEPKPPESDPLSGAHISPDPLLDSGSFIDPSTETGNGNGEVEHPGPSQKEEPSESKEEQQKQPAAEAELSTPTRRKQRRGSEDVAPGERPDWLPESWGMECRIRTSGATAGTIDRYYVDPVAGRRFRSKREVLHFIETGTKGKKRPSSAADEKPSESPGTQKKKKLGSKKKDHAAFSFDFRNPPEKVSWVLTDANEDRWSPSIGDGNLPESTKQEWAAVFDRICHS